MSEIYTELFPRLESSPRRRGILGIVTEFFASPDTSNVSGPDYELASITLHGILSAAFESTDSGVLDLGQNGRRIVLQRVAGPVVIDSHPLLNGGYNVRGWTKDVDVLDGTSSAGVQKARRMQQWAVNANGGGVMAVDYWRTNDEADVMFEVDPKVNPLFGCNEQVRGITGLASIEQVQQFGQIVTNRAHA